MEGEPIFNIRLIANQQGLETVKPSIGMFNHRAPFIEFFVKINPFYRLLSGRTGVDCNVGFDLSVGTSQAQILGIESTIGIEKQAFKINIGRLQQDAQLLKKLLDLKQVMVITLE